MEHHSPAKHKRMNRESSKSAIENAFPLSLILLSGEMQTHHISALVKLDSALGTVLNQVFNFSSISSNQACSGTPARQDRSPGVTR